MKDGSDSIPWIEKYRPQTLEDVAAHKEIIETIQRLSKEDKLPHLLLYGPPGTGKTSTILALARKIYGSSYQNNILMLNASDDRNIGVVRDQIQNFASTRRIFSTGFKLIILDEVDAMTKDAQFALRRVIEKYTKNTRFCLICNQANKIIQALQSRCTRFRFAPLGEEIVERRLKEILELEGVDFDEPGVKAVGVISRGDMRKALNILQATVLSSNKIGEDEVYLCTGTPLPKEIEQIVRWLNNDSFSDCVENIRKLQTLRGLALTDILEGIHAYIMRVHYPAEVRVFLVEGLADLEHRLAAGTSDTLQLGALVGIFMKARSTTCSMAV